MRLLIICERCRVTCIITGHVLEQIFPLRTDVFHTVSSRTRRKCLAHQLLPLLTQLLRKKVTVNKPNLGIHHVTMFLMGGN